MNINKYLQEEIGIERELFKYLSGQPDVIIFDIGACEAEDSIRYSKMFPASKIYSFEPLLKNFDRATKNLSDFGVTNTLLYQEALGNSIGKAIFHVSSGHPDYLEKTEDWDYGNKSSSLLFPKEQMPSWMTFSDETVSTNTLDNFCVQHKIDKIDFIHMDVQGAELMVLQGAENMLENVKIIWLEVGMVEFYENQPMKDDLILFLKNKGFSVIKDTCPSICGDILVVNNNLLKQ